LFGRDTTWTKTGVPAVKHLGEKVKKPEDSEKHPQNMIDIRDSKHCVIAQQGLQATNEYVKRESEKKPRYCLKID